MKTYCYILLVLLFACQKSEKKIVPAPQLIESLHQAEDLRFSHAEIADSILTANLDEIKSVDNDRLWSQYYFVKAHIVAEQDEYADASFLLDSATNTCSTFEAEYYPKIILLRARMNASLLMYDQAKMYYEELYETNLKQQLNSSELLRLTINYAFICSRLRIDNSALFEEAKTYVQKDNYADMGLLYSNLAYHEQDMQHAIKMFKQASDAFDTCGDYINAFYLQYNIASGYLSIDLDTAKYYLDAADIYYADKVEGKGFFKAEIQVMFSVLIRGKYLFASNDYRQAINEIEAMIPSSKADDCVNILHKYYSLLAKCYFEIGDFQKAMMCKDKERIYRLEYSALITSNKIHYNDAKEGVELIKRENSTLRLQRRNRNLQIKLIIAYSIFTTFLLSCLYVKRRNIVHALSIATQKIQKHNSIISQFMIKHDFFQKSLSEKDVLILTHQEQLEKIIDIVKNSPYKNELKLSLIENIIESEEVIQSWEVFNELYQHKFPEGEQQLRYLFSSLKLKDYQYLMCVHYGLSPDKMAIVLSIQKDSIRKRTQRIRQALNLTVQDDIRDFILNSLKKADFAKASY